MTSRSEEGTELVDCSRLGSLLRAGDRARAVGVEGDVVLDEMNPRGVLESGAHDDVHVVHGLGSEPGRLRSAGCKEDGVKPFEVLESELANREMPDCGGDVVVDHPLVAMSGRRSELQATIWHPRLVEETGDRCCGPVPGANFAGCAGQVCGDGFGVFAGVASEVPLSAVFAGVRVTGALPPEWCRRWASRNASTSS